MNVNKDDHDVFVVQAKMLRIFTLMAHLYKQKHTAKQLAEKLDLNERSVYRYLHFIEACGIEVDSIDNFYFIAQDDCPFCRGVINGSADIASRAVMPG